MDSPVVLIELFKEAVASGDSVEYKRQAEKYTSLDWAFDPYPQINAHTLSKLMPTDLIHDVFSFAYPSLEQTLIKMTTLEGVFGYQELEQHVASFLTSPCFHQPTMPPVKDALFSICMYMNEHKYENELVYEIIGLHCAGAPEEFILHVASALGHDWVEDKYNTREYERKRELGRAMSLNLSLLNEYAKIDKDSPTYVVDVLKKIKDMEFIGDDAYTVNELIHDFMHTHSLFKDIKCDPKAKQRYATKVAENADMEQGFIRMVLMATADMDL